MNKVSAYITPEKAMAIFKKQGPFVQWVPQDKWQDGTLPNYEGVKVRVKNFKGFVKNSAGMLSPKPSYIATIYLEYLGENIDQFGTIHVVLSYISKSGQVIPNVIDTSYTGNTGASETKSLIESHLGTFFESDEFLLPVEEKEVAEQKYYHEKYTAHEERMTRRKSPSSKARAINVYVNTDPDFDIIPPEAKLDKKGVNVYYVITDIESNKEISKKLIYSTNNTEQAIKFVGAFTAKSVIPNGFVRDEHKDYIPEWANKNNWDFLTNTSIEKQKELEKQEHETSPEKPETSDLTGDFVGKEELLGIDEDEDGEDEYDPDFFSASHSWYKVAQYEGYFNDNVPDYLGGMVGSSMVDASQLKSSFGRTDEAIQLVNQFNPSLLSNVAIIFNFSKGGAYGVYLPKLDRDIKLKALKKNLEGNGYTVEVNQDGSFTAYHEQRTPDEINNDITNGYADLEREGGSAFGININSILQASRQDAIESDHPDPNSWEWITLLHLGGTLVHEATHAKGHHDESPAESAEDTFTAWALPIINEKYQQRMMANDQEELYAPLIIGNGKRYASSKMEKTAQYIPQQLLNAPRGSDLAGRFPMHLQRGSGPGTGPWSMIFENKADSLVEKMLSRQYMSMIPVDLNQDKDIIEDQLRKMTRDDDLTNGDYLTEEWLAKDYDNDSIDYKLIEELLEEGRPYPLLEPIKKASLKKLATIFGWMNNLDISMPERVWPWSEDEREMKEREEQIRSQPRYNPEYDIKGFYYRWIEPRFSPELWTNMTRNRSGVHPARRFAQTIEVDETLNLVFSVLENIASKILNKDILATRLVCSDDIAGLICDFFDEVDCNISLFRDPKQQDFMAIWFSCNDVDTNDLEKIENILSKSEVSESEESFIENILQIRKCKTKAIKEVFCAAKEICEKYNIDDFYAVGGYVRNMVMGEDIAEINDIDFSCSFPDQCLKVGGLIAEKLGISNPEFYHRTMTLTFTYKGIKIDFKGKFVPSEIRELMRKKDIKITPFNIDIYNRDFTMNMLVYDIKSSKVYDPTGMGYNDLKNGVIRTFFEPSSIVVKNPYVMLRAMRFKAEYDFSIDPDLERAIIENGHSLLEVSWDVTLNKIICEREKVKQYGIDKAIKIFEEYGVGELEDL